MKKVILEPVIENTVNLDSITDNSIVGIHFSNFKTKCIVLKHPVRSGFYCMSLKENPNSGDKWFRDSVKEVIENANKQALLGVFVFENYFDAFTWANN